jgi:hypothetical protein
MQSFMIHLVAAGPSFTALGIAGSRLPQLTSAQAARFGILSIGPAMFVLLHLCHLAAAVVSALALAETSTTGQELGLT